MKSALKRGRLPYKREEEIKDRIQRVAVRYSDHFCQSGQLKDRERNPIIRAPAKFTTYEDILEATEENQREEEALKTSPKSKPSSSKKREELKKKLTTF